MSAVAHFVDVTAFPVVQTPSNQWTGGLFSSDGSLIFEAAHIRSSDNSTAQSFPETYVGREPLELSVGLYGGFFFNHFGHFVTESLGRLWAANLAEYQHLPIYVDGLWGQVDFAAQNNFAAEILRLFEIDKNRIRFIDKPLKFKTIYVPEMQYGFHKFLNPGANFVSEMQNAQNRIEREISREISHSARIYVSRSKWTALRGVVAGEAQFESFLVQQGWSSIYPEEMSFGDQLRSYAAAEYIIFAEGSSQHSCILLPQLKAKVAVILRRDKPWDVSRVTDQFGGFKKNVEAIKYINARYCFGLPEWSGVTVVDYGKVVERLRSIGFVGSRFSDWEAVSEKAVDEAITSFVASALKEKDFLSFLKALPEPR